MDKEEFDLILYDIRQHCFHMSDKEASVVIDKFIEEHPELLEFKTREWLIKNS